MKFCLKWVHMARYELILRLDGALWHTIISKPLSTPKKAMEGPTTRLLYKGPVTTKILYTNKKPIPICCTAGWTETFELPLSPVRTVPLARRCSSELLLSCHASEHAYCWTTPLMYMAVGI